MLHSSLPLFSRCPSLFSPYFPVPPLPNHPVLNQTAVGLKVVLAEDCLKIQLFVQQGFVAKAEEVYGFVVRLQRLQD